MRRLRLAYRDYDRTPVIFCIKEMARHYDVDVEVLRIRGTQEYEAALYEDRCDVIIEHLEYFYARRGGQPPVTMFCAPQVESDLQLVVPAGLAGLAELCGQAIAVRSSGRYHTVTQRLRALGLADQVRTVIVSDADVGRWGQWRKVLAGECIGTFISPLYLKPALSVGLKVLPTPKLPLIGHFAQACLSSFAAAKRELLDDYVKAVIHAIALMKCRRYEALVIVSREPAKLMDLTEPAEIEWRLDAIAADLQAKPYPTLEAIANSYEAAVVEYPETAAANPLACWDLHWVKQLDDAGFIDTLMASMVPSP